MKDLLKVASRYGAVAGVLATVLLILMYYTGTHPFLISPFLDFRIFIFGILIFFALKEFRNNYQDGLLYFWQGLFGSFVVVMLGSAIAAVGLYVFGSVEKNFVTSYVQQMTAYLKTFPKEDIERIGKEIYERNLNALPSTNIATLVLTHFAQGMMIGFFISVIFSVILRKTT